jgi:hypothetical protein
MIYRRTMGRLEALGPMGSAFGVGRIGDEADYLTDGDCGGVRLKTGLSTLYTEAEAGARDFLGVGEHDGEIGCGIDLVTCQVDGESVDRFRRRGEPEGRTSGSER